MRIQLKIEGGLAYFPGLSKPITIDGNALPPQEADKLKQLLDAAHFFDLPPVLKTCLAPFRWGHIRDQQDWASTSVGFAIHVLRRPPRGLGTSPYVAFPSGVGIL